MKADRVVLDTNVLISAALSRTGPPRRVVHLVRADNGILLFSDETFAELRHRILGCKFDRYVGRESRADSASLVTDQVAPGASGGSPIQRFGPGGTADRLRIRPPRP